MAKSANELGSVAPRVNGIGFRQQLVLIFIVGVGSLALILSLTISSLSNAILRDHIIEQGQQATQTLAARSTLALLSRSPEKAKEVAEAIMAFPGVLGVGVFDPAHKPLLSKGVASLPLEGLAQWPKRLHLDQATKKHWYFVAPVHAQGSNRDAHYSSPLASSPHAADLLGYVRVVMGTEDIRSLAGKILGTSLGVWFTFASLLLLVLLATTARLTAPLRSLADIMKRAEAGEMHVRAKLQGTKDVVEMGNAFNTMMAVLEAREHQFEKARDTARNGHDPNMRQTFESTVPEETPRVLIVDDDRGLRQTLRHVLREGGYRVEEAENGAKALAFCKRHLPDLILMDAVMPVMDGFTACGHIRQLPGGSDIPVLIITALDDEPTIDRAFSCGASDYIGKPVHFPLLRQRVRRLLDAWYAQQRAHQLAYRDGLTLLPNRNMFHDRLEAVINGPREDQHVHALLFLDLDRFKLVNDALGHEIGDLLLKAVGERIQACVRGGNSVARIGEDEFSVILENITCAERAAQVAEKIRKAVASPFSFLGQQVYVGGSIGISIFPNNAQDDRTLIKQTDMALSRAKALGRDRHCFYETGIGASVSKRMEMESELRRALERDEIILFYQPQVDLKSGRITGMEALVRWQHPERGVISPVQFIPLAEESGLIVPIGEWVMGHACKQAKAWIDTGIAKAITVAVNVSARQFDQLEDSVARVLDETGLDPHFLELELTESSVMRDPKEMVTKLRCLKEIGVQIAIDDFGTGYSSLSYLKHFPFDKLKIDRSFINNVTVDPDDAAIAVTIISMAHNLKLKAIAEGVETEGQLLYLARQGCDEIQGYYFCKPLCKDAATQLLEKDTRLIFNKFTKPNRQTVLIVDDDPVVLALLSRLLEQDNREVLSADSARAGLELLATHHVQVVVSDQVMPEMDGIEFLSRVKELHPETVRIILTGHAEPETITKAVNKGWIYKFMSKPWDDEDLRAQVKEAFAHHLRSSKKKLFIRQAS